MPQANLVVQSSCETHDTLNVGQDSKRYKNRSKIGVETTKGIFLVVNVRFFIKSVLKVKCKVSAAFCYYPKEENKKCHSG